MGTDECGGKPGGVDGRGSFDDDEEEDIPRRCFRDDMGIFIDLGGFGVLVECRFDQDGNFTRILVVMDKE